MPPITFGGLASGLDTAAMVEAIMNFERQPLERLQARQQVFSQSKAAFDELLAKLNEFESALRDLTSASTFRGRIATVSDESVLRATPGTGAETGIFDIDVVTLAAAHKVKSDGFLSPDQALVADGTITIQAGDNDLITVDVSATDGSNSLQAIRDSINAADAGVQASILFNGTDYLLTVRSTDTGTANALAITDSTDLNLDDAGNQVVAAADASIVVDGIAVTSSSNKLSNVIPGVTLDLLSDTAGSSINLEVAQDEDAVVGAVQDLVSQYNDVISFFNEQFSRDNPGPLAGDFTARQVQIQIQSLITGGVEGLPLGSIRSLSAIGVSFDGKTGEASLDTAELRELLQTDFDAVGNVFLSAGVATDPRIQYIGATSSTQAGTYAIAISQAAEQATVSGETTITTLGQNETLTIDVNGDAATVNLTSGQTLAQVVDAVNQALRDEGVRATARDDGGELRIIANDFGSGTTLSVTSDLAGSGTGFTTVARTDDGVDVVGTIDGVAGIGNGQTLSAADGTPSAGLILRVTATPAAVISTGGDFGTLSFSRGLVANLLQRVDAITKFDSGQIDVARQSLDSRIDSLTRDIERTNERLALRERQLVLAFSRAERAISQLNAQQSSLGSVTLF